MPLCSSSKTKSVQYVEYAKAVRQQMLEQAINQAWQRNSTKEIGRVIVILSAPRGGSSLLYSILSSTDQLLSLSGEHTPFYKLNGYSFPFNSFQSDHLGVPSLSAKQAHTFSRDIMSDLFVGPALKQPTVAQLKDFALTLALRLPLQWPNLQLTSSRWLGYTHQTMEAYLRKPEQWNLWQFFSELIATLRQDYPLVNPVYYDLAKFGVLAKDIYPQPPQLSYALGPPNAELCIEEPPFIIPALRRRPTAAEIRAKPLLLKATVDVYRLPLLRQLFPNADFQIIHLTRDPRHSINSLYEGWLSHGYFSHNLKDVAELKISGYSERQPFGTHWWNYELPPHWKTLIGEPLETICGEQWRHSHEAALNICSSLQSSSIFRLSFEDVLNNPATVLNRLQGFIGFSFDARLSTKIKNPPQTMTFHPHSADRWQIRQNVVLRGLNRNPKLLGVAEMLGYPC